MKSVMAMSLMMLFTVTVDGQTLDDLSSLRWKNRVVILNEIADHDQFLQVLETQQKEIKERDILWFVLFGSDALSNYSGSLSTDFSNDIRQKYQLKKRQVVLIGKDGGLKSSFDGVNLNAIFSDIDAMPMRQQEMQR